MTPAMVAPLDLRSRATTRACFEFARALNWPLRPALDRTLDEDRAFALCARLRLDIKHSCTRDSTSSRRHHANPAEAYRRWRGNRSERSSSGSVTSTHALFARNVQRKESNGLLDCPPPDHL